ncbi:MAG: DUF3313 domain-containing protein [Lysobacteraceae bacterium]|nr:MAG: DUF3313 domain-containing protein [Xanthomonadaceae bacterium]
MKTSLALAIGALALLAGCRSTGGESSSVAEGGAAQSARTGFLGDYSQLQPAPDAEGLQLYMDRSGNYSQYTRLMLDPVQIIAVPGPEQQQLSPDVAARMSDNLHASLRRTLEPAYQIVTTPGPDVLRVRIAITHVQPVKTELGVTDFIPIKALYNAGRAVAGNSPRVAEMSAEVEVLDPANRRAMAATATRRGDRTLPQGEQLTWASMQSISDYWARGFRARLDELRGVPRGAAP